MSGSRSHFKCVVVRDFISCSPPPRVVQLGGHVMVKLKASSLVKASLLASVLIGACAPGAAGVVQPAPEEEAVVTVVKKAVPTPLSVEPSIPSLEEEVMFSAEPGISFVEEVSPLLNQENYLTETTALNDYEGRITEIVLQANSMVPLLPAYESLFENMPDVQFTVVANTYVDEQEPKVLFDRGENGYTLECPTGYLLIIDDPHNSHAGCDQPPQPDFTIAELEALVGEYPNVSLVLYDDERILTAWARDTQLVLLSHNGMQRAIVAFGTWRRGSNSLDSRLGEDFAEQGIFDLAVTEPLISYAPGDVVSNGHITIVGHESFKKAGRDYPDEELKDIFNEIYDSEQTILLKEEPPYFHTDLYISFLSGDNHVAVAQVPPDNDKAEELDNVADYLESEGLVVERMPAMRYLTYHNLLMESYVENGERKSVVYIPDLDDPEGLAEVKELYERYGFEVVVIDGLTQVITEGLGGMRCLSLIIRRE